MTSQQIKSYVTLRHVDQITRFEAVSDEQIVKAYHFTDQLRGIAMRLLASLASNKGAYAVVSDRGTGKSHMLALVRSLANQPHLALLLEDPEATSCFTPSLEKFPKDGLSTLTIGFEQDKGLNFLRAFPKAPGLEGELPSWISTDQIDELIERRILNAGRFGLFIDGISSILRNPQQSGVMIEWLKYLASEADSKGFSLIVALDQNLAEAQDELGGQLRSICSYEKINTSNCATIIDQVIFRKTPQQQKTLESLFADLKTRIPHFTGTLSEFTQLYPVHPIVLQISPAMRKYARTFSFFGFTTAVASRALVRRALSLICLDDLFESFEFDLRKNPALAEAFSAYDHLFTSVISGMEQQHSLYAKMMLKGLLLLSLAGKESTASELADSVMLYDDREPRNFYTLISSIMDQLAESGNDISIDDTGQEPRYILNLLKEPAQPIEVSRSRTGNISHSNLPVAKPVIEPPKPIAKPVATPIVARPVVEPVIEPVAATTATTKRQSRTSPKAEPKAEAPKEMPTSRLHEMALKLNDDDLQLDEMLVAAGKKHFKDWPFVLDANGQFRDRVEINIKWRGSLRKGIFKFGGGVELRSMSKDGLDDGKPLSEYDWQITLFRSYAPMMMPPPPGTPATLLYWHPVELTNQERLTLKLLLAAKIFGAELPDDEQTKQALSNAESELAAIFERVYLKNGKFFRSNGDEITLNYQSSAFINIILTKLLDNPLRLRYPNHPKFEELLDPDYVNDMASWMFSPEESPTPDQQLYLEQFAKPLQLVKVQGGRYRLDVRDKEFLPESPVAQLVEAIKAAGSSPLSRMDVYKAVRLEPFGLQRPALLLILAAFVASNRLSLLDEFGEMIHNESGLRPDTELADFSAICSTPTTTQLKEVSWKSQKESTTGSLEFRGYTIMVVDDDPNVHIVMELALKPLGCNLEKASDGLEALQKMEKKPINLIISDLRMPNMTGIELFYKMQTHPKLRDIPFVVLTSIDADDEVATALENGVEDYWIKPFRVQEITARIKRVLKRRLTSSGAYALAAWPERAADDDASDTIEDTIEESVEAASEHPIENAASEPVANEESLNAVKIDNSAVSKQESKILPSPAVSRVPVANNDKTNTKSLPSIPHPPIPHPPVPVASEASNSTPQPELVNPAKSSYPTMPVVPQSPAQKADELVIPSVTSEFPALTEDRHFEITDEEEDGSASSDEEQDADNSGTKQVFSIKLSNPESAPIDIMLLYNQFWDSCRRVGGTATTPEYEDFKSLIIHKAKKLKKQFNCDDLVFSVEVENGVAHVDCQVTRMDDYLKKQPKFRLI